MKHAGAFIERGQCTEVAAGQCRIESLDRPGIFSPPIRIQGGRGIQEGDLVIFALFPDGKTVVFWNAKESE